MKKLLTLALTVIFLAISITTASASYMADLTYTYVDNGSGNFTFEFTVTNTSTGADIGALDFFEIQFDADTDHTLYSNVAMVVDNGWYSGAFEDTPGGNPAGVSFDAYQSFPAVPGIDQGDSSGGFRFSFDYTGSLAPTEQTFWWAADFGSNEDGNGIRLFEGVDFWILGTVEGTTSYSTPVPEPTTLLLFSFGLIGLAGLGRKKYKHN